ncbi:MAG: flagellar biosynthesis anti-sigma factor FlgM [Terriglobales bacterium]
MRINNPSLDPSLAAQNRPENTNRVTTANSSLVSSGSGAHQVTGDQATLASSAVQLTALAMAQPEVRSGLVQQLRAQVASGSYAVDPTNVAEAMLADPQTGLGTSGHG